MSVLTCLVLRCAATGTSEWNLLGKWQGQTDTLLAPEGELQAQRTGQMLSEMGVRFDAVRCSDLKRAQRTAILLAAACGVTNTVIPDVRLRECSLGIFEGKHKDEIFGPRYADLFKQLSQLPHEARIRTAYFDKLETPLEISTRALSAARELAATVPPGSTVALVTHSVILESLCASAFHKDFESVHTQTLAWLRCTEGLDGRLQLESSSGAVYVDSPDALALDPGAATLEPASATSTTALRRKNAVACASAVGVALGVAAAGRGGRPLASTAVASLASGLAAALGSALALRHCAVRDARVTAVVNGGVGSLALAGGLLRVPGARALSLVFAAHAAYAFAAVAASEVLTGLGWRASLRAGAKWGLWLPRVVVARPAEIAGAQPEIGGRGTA